MKRSAALWLMAAFAASAAAQTSWIQGMAPNWDQPYDYPDAYDASGPGPEPNPNGLDPWDAWCTPSAGAMLLGHWEDVRGRAGLADGSVDGNQAVPAGYGGPLWGNAGNWRIWHDFQADGSMLRGARNVEDLGWYMDTNRLGDPLLGNGAHTGTYYKDAAAGLNTFFTRIGAPAVGLTAATVGVHAAFGGLTVAQLAGVAQTEVDANRTLVAHFSHWNVVGPGGPGQGNQANANESQFGFSDYTWGNTQMGGLHGEEWNGQTDLEGLGHSVTVVGYTLAAGQITHLIVHDNSPFTVRNVRIPVDFHLVGVTTVIPEPASLLAFGTGLAVLMVRCSRRRR